MARSERGIALLHEHMGWARTYAVYWFLMCLLIFGAAFAVGEVVGVSAESRAPMFFMIGTIIVVNAIWQAAGLLIVRLEEVVLPRSGRN
jgi:hypothetical protein